MRRFLSAPLLLYISELVEVVAVVAVIVAVAVRAYNEQELP